jgi:hypothetical protein
MDDLNYIRTLLEKSGSFDIDIYKDINLKKSHAPYEGTPKKHPTDKNILILLTNPFSKRSQFYEFSLESIGNIEDLGTITSEEGESAYMVRVWIKRGLTALKTEPFIVK